MHDVDAIPSLTANSIWKSFLKYELQIELQFPGHPSYFRKYLKMLLAVNIGHAYSPHRALGQNNYMEGSGSVIIK